MVKKLLVTALFGLSLVFASGAWAEYFGEGQELKAIDAWVASTETKEVKSVSAPTSSVTSDKKETASGEVKSPLINKVRDAYSIKRPEATEVTVVVGKIPASLLKFSKFRRRRDFQEREIGSRKNHSRGRRQSHRPNSGRGDF
jgi:hypothetical protein